MQLPKTHFLLSTHTSKIQKAPMWMRFTIEVCLQCYTLSRMYCFLSWSLAILLDFNRSEPFIIKKDEGRTYAESPTRMQGDRAQIQEHIIYNK